MFTHAQACACVYVSICIYTQTHARAHTYTPTHIYIPLCVYVHTHAVVYTHYALGWTLYVRTHIYTYVHIHTLRTSACAGAPKERPRGGEGALDTKNGHAERVSFRKFRQPSPLACALWLRSLAISYPQRHVARGGPKNGPWEGEGALDTQNDHAEGVLFCKSVNFVTDHSSFVRCAPRPYHFP